MKSLIRFANEALMMQDEIYRLRAENARLKKIEEQYHKLLDDSLGHAQTMAGNQLKMLLTPGVASALQAAKASMDGPPSDCPACHGEREWDSPGMAICHHCGVTTTVGFPEKKVAKASRSLRR